VLAAQRAQLAERQAVLMSGARHVGWKVGLGIPGADELIGDRPVFGYLTSATEFESGRMVEVAGVRKLQVDCELAVELGHDVDGDGDLAGLHNAIAGVATALELCDVGRPPDDFDSIVAANVFHRAYALGPALPHDANATPAARVRVNRELRHQAAWSDDVFVRILALAQLLEAVGKRLRAGDRIICGALCGGLIERGDDVEVRVGELDPVRAVIAG
jgi:2-keto-4-pentenoate hydratase